MKKPNLDYVLYLMAQRGFRVFDRDDKPFNLNLVAVRTTDQTPNKFNDWFCVFWKYRGNWQLLRFPCTTDPGLYWLGSERMGNGLGTAMLIEQQVLGGYKWGRHRNYAALEQVKPAKLVRDFNKDGRLNPDYDKVYEIDASTNIHRASQLRHVDDVGAYSAGCVVLPSPDEFWLLGYLCKEATKHFANRFTFSLIDENLNENFTNAEKI